MIRRAVLVVVFTVALLGGLAGSASADPCDWERGGVVETVPAVCPDPVQVDQLPPYLLLAGGLLVFAGFAGLIGAWRH